MVEASEAKSVKGFMKLFSKQMAGVDEQTKSQIEKDVIEVSKFMPSFSKTIDNGLTPDGRYSRTISVDIRGYYRTLVANLKKMEKPYLRFLQSYPSTL